MSTNLQTGSEPTLTSMVSGIIDDFQELIKQQLDLFKTELAADFQKTKEASLLLAFGIGGLFLASALLCVMMVHLLAWFFPSWPLWAFYLLVGGVVACLSGGLTFAAWRRFHAVNADQSMKALRETLEWKTKPN